MHDLQVSVLDQLLVDLVFVCLIVFVKRLFKDFLLDVEARFLKLEVAWVEHILLTLRYDFINFWLLRCWRDAAGVLLSFENKGSKACCFCWSLILCMIFHKSRIRQLGRP